MSNGKQGEVAKTSTAAKVASSAMSVQEALGGTRAQPVLEQWEHFNRKARNWSNEKSDKITNAVLDNMLNSMGRTVREIARNSAAGVQPRKSLRRGHCPLTARSRPSAAEAFFRGTPEWWLAKVDRFVISLWGSLQPVLREYMTGPVPGDYSRLLVLNWSTEYPFLWPKDQWPQPYGWLRGRRRDASNRRSADCARRCTLGTLACSTTVRL